MLFGSRAKGDYLEDSDVDLLVVSQDFEGKPFYERILAIERELRGEAEVFCYTPSEVFATINREKVRLDVVDALEHGVPLYGSRFWESLREAYVSRKFRRDAKGWILLD